MRGNEKQLFISFVKPHKPVGSTAIARWVTNILKLAGIDTAVFKAHSTRSASTSHAYKMGVPIADILKSGDWNSASTFQRFYQRPVIHAKFAQAILEDA